MKIIGACLIGAATLAALGSAASAQPTPTAPNQVSGLIRSVSGTTLLLETRRHTMMLIDAAPAIEAHMNVLLKAGRLVIVEGTIDSKGVMHATMIDKAKRQLDPSILDY